MKRTIHVICRPTSMYEDPEDQAAVEEEPTAEAPPLK
jgi:hypothetical protein